MAKVNIGLQDKIHAQAKIIATVKKISLAEYLEKAVEKAVQDDKKLLEEILK
jgi:predicted HicB family RNase H-like nuclease